MAELRNAAISMSMPANERIARRPSRRARSMRSRTRSPSSVATHRLPPMTSRTEMNSGALIVISQRRCGPLQQAGQVIVDASYIEIRFSPKRLAQVTQIEFVAVKPDEGKDEIFRLVERGHDFVARDGDRIRANGAAFHFYETQFARAHDARFHIVAAILRAHV